MRGWYQVKADCCCRDLTRPKHAPRFGLLRLLFQANPWPWNFHHHADERLTTHTQHKTGTKTSQQSTVEPPSPHRRQDPLVLTTRQLNHIVQQYTTFNMGESRCVSPLPSILLVSWEHRLTIRFHRQELVAWLNNLLQLNITKVEQCGTG